MDTNTDKGLNCTNDEGVFLPTYAVWLMSILIIILFAIIIFLIVLLRKRIAIASEYKVFTRPNTSTSLAFEKSEFQRQDSKGMGSLKSSPPKTFSECDSIKIEDSFSQSCSVRKISLQPPQSPILTSMSANNVTLPLRIKKITPTSVILPEQMRAICRDVLSKRSAGHSTSFKDLNEMLNAFTKHDKNCSAIREKSMSTPDLDIYDTLPRKTEEAKKEELDDSSIEKKDDDDDNLYDRLPTQHLNYHQNIIVDKDTQYLLPLTGTTTPNEPSYINANVNKYIL